MAYTVGVNDIVEVTFKGVLFNQQCMNVRHYKVTTIGAVTDGATLLSSINDALQVGGGLDEAFANVQSSLVIQRKIRLQWIFTQRYRAREFDSITTEGQDNNDCKTANVAASIELAAEEADRHGIGRQQIYGIASSRILDGRPVAAYLTLLGALATALVGNIITADGVTLVPVILNRGGPNLSYVVRQAGPKNEIRAQRSRVIGLGI